MDNSKIIERIRKLFALSKSANEHEAAAAAAKASQLMREHEIGEAMLRVSDDARTAEGIVEGGIAGTKVEGKRVAWKCFIASGAAKAFGVEMWFVGGKITGLGRVSAVQSWDYTCQYLYREVDRLADEAWNGPAGELPRWNDVSPRAWKNAFRVGASHAIRKRLKEQAEAQEASKRRDIVIAAAELHGPDAEARGEARTQALAIIDHDRAEVMAAYEARAKGFGKATAIGQTSSRSGYVAGVDAGRKVSLGGGGRGGLPAPKGQIRGAR